MKKINFKKIKRETAYLVITVLCLTIVMLGTSYSIFFDVKTNANEHTITTGDLSVQFTSGDDTVESTLVYPLSDAEGLSGDAQSIFYVQNSGSIDGAFTFTITENAANELSLEYIKMAVFEYNSSSTVDNTQLSDIIILNDCITDENGDYVAFSSTISSGSSTTYVVKFWLDEDCPEEIMGEALDLSINVLSEVLDSVMLYNISGYLYNSDSSVLANATISLNNGSIIGVSNSSGYYSLLSVRSGTYSVNITSSDGTVYKDILTVEEDSTPSVSSGSDSYYLKGGLESSITLKMTVSGSSVYSMEIY